MAKYPIKRDLRIMAVTADSSEYSALIYAGAQQYLNIHPHTELFPTTIRTPLNDLLLVLTEWQPDGILGVMTPGTVARDFLQSVKLSPRPVVVTTRSLMQPGYGVVCVDHSAVIRAAVQHLRQRGINHMLFVGLQYVGPSSIRQQAFTQYTQELNLTGHVFILPAAHPGYYPAYVRAALQAVVRPLLRRDQPLGVICFSDWMAMMMQQTCLQEHWHIPKQVAICGINNELNFCAFRQPTLTSVDCGWEAIGLRAMEMLADMIEGQPAPAEPVSMPKILVVERMSTALGAGYPQVVQNALRIMDARLTERIGTDVIAKGVNESRRGLERLFEKHVGMGIAAAMTARRVERAKHLLRTSTQTVGHVGRNCGFVSDWYFGHVFKKHTGLTPLAYRKQSKEIPADTTMSADKE